MERDIGEPSISIGTSINNRDQLYHIDIALHNLVSTKRVQNYLSEMLAKVIKMALMERYADIQTVVDEVILSSETKDLVKNAIRVEVERMTNQAIQEMFGGK